MDARNGAVGGPAYIQPSFDELGEPLREVSFVVVDLETTGGSSRDCGITEIGAVKVRGGERIGEFATLVDPGCAIPPYITVLTGITDAMVLRAPMIETVLPAFLEFARGCVLVAHNAPFDLGFLRSACQRTGRPWPGARSLDTAVLARRVLSRDEVPNCKLGTLAPYFHATTSPTHRALDDARATVDVLHGLLERVGGLGVHSLEELGTFTYQVSAAQRRKRYLAESLPHAPGVYVFRDREDRPLYVGTSQDLRRRVRSYFVSSEQRTRMAEMIGLAERVEAIVCAHPLEAAVRELRLIATHKPRYNRRSRFPERALWLKLTDEVFPRLSSVRVVAADGCAYLGPFGSRFAIERAAAAVYEAVPLRQCGGRLPLRPSRSACALAEIHRCNAPCDGSESRQAYAVHARVFRDAVTGDAEALAAPSLARIDRLSAAGRFEDAAVVRDRLATLLRACARLQRLVGLTSIAQLVAARPDGSGGWALAVIRHGRLAAAGVAARGVAPGPYVDALLRLAETVTPGHGPLPASTADETDRLLDWLEGPGTRLVAATSGWASPARGAGRMHHFLDRFEAGRAAASPFADRRRLVTLAQPARASA